MSDDVDPLVDVDRLHDLAAGNLWAVGPWEVRRGPDAELVIWAGNEPVAHVYAGTDCARYLCELAPARLLGGYR